MSLYSNATITRFAERAETEFATAFPCILKRVGVANIIGTSLYTLPQDVFSIRKVSWKGYRLVPLGHREFRENLGYPVGNGQPEAYIFNNVGELAISLFPAPSLAISATQTNLFLPSVIREKFIVEYWAAPDFVDFKIPAYMRRRLLKAGINASCFALEGRGKTNKSAAYWDEFYKLLTQKYGQRLNALNYLPRRIASNGSYERQAYSKVGRLPSNFGVSVDEGY